MARRMRPLDRMLAAITQGDRRHLPELRTYCAVFGVGVGLFVGYFLGGLIWAPVAALVLGVAAYFVLPFALHLGIFALGWAVILGGIALVAAALWWGWQRFVG